MSTDRLQLKLSDSGISLFGTGATFSHLQPARLKGRRGGAFFGAKIPSAGTTSIPLNT